MIETHPARRIALKLLIIALFLPWQIFAQGSVEESVLWKALADGSHHAIIRHAIAPGFSDPEGFSLDDCTTQRNLSEEGRIQARMIGKLIRSNGISGAQVFTSQWCRCRETAANLNLGTVMDLLPLNSFFRDMSREREQTRELISWLQKRKSMVPLVLVTHQVNIRGLTGTGTMQGEVVFFRLDDDTVSVLGQIPVPLQ